MDIARDDIGIASEQSETITEAASITMRLEGFVQAEADITVTDNKMIRELNRIHRGIDKETDCLSFPQYEREELTMVNRNSSVLLGDIVISYEKAVEQANNYGHGILRELAFLTAHSALHLLGYDHAREDEERAMRHKQREVLRILGL